MSVNSMSWDIMRKSPDYRTCAIVVTYQPDFTALLTLLGQLNRETDFIVVDNGSAEIARLAESIMAYQRCRELLRLDHNHGLARALNIGIARARQQGCDFVFLFDQDSSLCDLFIARMVAAYQDAVQHSASGIAAVGPRIINPQTVRQTPFKLFTRWFARTDQPYANTASHYLADFLITSGTLLVVEHLDRIGLMKESYFIDNVDLEWCFRAKSLGFELIGTDAALLYHAIGERSLNPLVRVGIMAQHNPSRTYYSSRNRTHLHSVNYAPWGWKIRDRVRFFLKAGWLLIASSHRRQYWQSIRSGIRDAKSLT